MTPDAQVLLKVPANHLDRPASALEQIISLPAILTGARGRVARTVILTATIVISTARGYNFEFVSWSRKKIIAAIQQARAAQGLPQLMQ